MPPHWSWPQTVGITGYAQVGKDTAAEVFVAKGYRRIAFADQVRTFSYALNPRFSDGWDLKTYVDQFGWEDAKRRCSEVREVMKDVGRGAREAFGENFWIERALHTAGDRAFVVVSDLRFLNEAAALRREKAVLIRITRPGVGPESDFEKEVDSIEPDCVVSNEGSIEDLHFAVMDAFLDVLKVRAPTLFD